jgi:hypothetical protein
MSRLLTQFQATGTNCGKMLKIYKIASPYEFRIKTLEMKGKIFHSQEIIVVVAVVVVLVLVVTTTTTTITTTATQV